MKRFYSGLVMVALLFLCGAHSCTKSELTLSDSKDEGTKAKSEKMLGASCKVNDECTTIKADCCGCRQGGTQKAIAKEQAPNAKAALQANCGGVMCTQAISTHESCGKNSLCKSGNCVLE